MDDKTVENKYDIEEENEDDIMNNIEKIVIKKLTKFAEKELTKKHGSKVKRGLYEECKITLVGTKACIYLGNREYLELTDENVQKIKFIKEKHKINHTYYYYEIEFHNGRSSYVRMRRKYKEAMYEHCSCI